MKCDIQQQNITYTENQSQGLCDGVQYFRVKHPKYIY